MTNSTNGSCGNCGRCKCPEKQSTQPMESTDMTDSTTNTPQYTGVDDPKLLDAARASLRERYPSLTDNDIENLVGVEANRLLNGGTDSSTHTG